MGSAESSGDRKESLLWTGEGMVAPQSASITQSPRAFYFPLEKLKWC